MKILLISGHGAGDSGAVGCGYKEADLTRTATSLLQKYLKKDGATVTRYPVGRNAYEDNKLGRMQKSFIDYGLVVEIHFNSYNKKAYGCEVLYKPASMKVLAAKVSAAIASFGFLNRGAKQRTDLMNMNTCARFGVPYILIETAFIDNNNDMKLYHKKIDDIWAKVAGVIKNYYGIKKTAQNAYKATFPVLPAKGYLAKGDTGTQVTRLQKFLSWYGVYKGAIDGSFGPATVAAVKAFQKAEGLAVDGSFGPASLARAKKVKK